ncbi:P-type conjugative transfer protein TrbJ [Bradyrhizobium huanghuaihaiense]|uniref:P-type conjugative transfer protein TrbJ n=1 Tax=Bradyrhizobium huanghuaihaiense TaxID=990078 RepID=A0A562QRW5_9BRAD|nr:P-type conjugative transfer protein TrbJ [Bradyrhizobium huanghuaihaiense]
MTALEVRRAGLAAATALSLAFSISPLSTTSVLAQWIVYDPTNFSQNVLTAARELQQINNQIQMLTNQAQSLVNQGKNLANLPLSTLTQLQSSIAKTQSLLTRPRTSPSTSSASRRCIPAPTARRRRRAPMQQCLPRLKVVGRTRWALSKTR